MQNVRLPWNLCVVILLILGSSFTSYAQVRRPVDSKAIDSVLELHYFSTLLPGYAMCVVQDGAVVYSGLRGRSNVRDDVKMSLQTQFNIGSVTKQFTAAAIFLLEESGSLSLNDPVRKYIPAFPEYPIPITLEHLMHHTSGLRDHFEVANMLGTYKNKLTTAEGMMEWVQKYPELNSAPGTWFSYSNTNYMLLAMVIENVSGMSYAEFLMKHIFLPLGMQHSYVESGKHKFLADGTTHYSINNKQTRAKRQDPLPNALGAVGVISTPEDMVRWDENFYHNILGKGSSDLIEKMITPGKLTDGTEVNYGGGILLKTYRGAVVEEHSGGWGEYLVQYRRFPEAHTSIIVCMNSYLTSPFEMTDHVSDVLFNYKGVHLFSKAYVDTTTLDKLCGLYAAENNLLRYLFREGNTLFAARISEGDTTAYPLQYAGELPGRQGYGFLDSTGHGLAVYTSGNAPAYMMWSGGTNFTTDRKYLFADTTGEIPFSKYHGKYYCAAYDKKVRIQYFFREDEFSIHPFPFVKYTLNSKGGPYFQVEEEPYILHFTNNGFLFGNDWGFNIRFEKKIKKQIDLWPFNNRSGN